VSRRATARRREGGATFTSCVAAMVVTLRQRNSCLPASLPTSLAPPAPPAPPARPRGRSTPSSTSTLTVNVTPSEACGAPDAVVDGANSTLTATPCARAVAVASGAAGGGGGGLLALGPAVPTASPDATASPTPTVSGSTVLIGGRGANETGGGGDSSGVPASFGGELFAWLLSAVAGAAGVLVAMA
jgi:hypothetical protein